MLMLTTERKRNASLGVDIYPFCFGLVLVSLLVCLYCEQVNYKTNKMEIGLVEQAIVLKKKEGVGKEEGCCFKKKGKKDR